MEQSKLKGVVSSLGDELYRRLARRAIIAMVVSVVFEGELACIRTYATAVSTASGS
jgi:hypothetical protein